MAEPDISFTPRWDMVEAYARDWARTQHWRVRLVCDDVEDALGECMMVYAKLARHYAGKITNSGWFTALYKKALERYWVQLARQHRRRALANEAAERIAQWAPRSEPALGPTFTALTKAIAELRQAGIGGDPCDLAELVLRRTAERGHASIPPPQLARLALRAIRARHGCLF